MLLRYCRSLPPVLGFLFAMPCQAADLWTAYEFAKARDPVVAQARARLEAEQARGMLARSALLPKASVSGGINRTGQNSSGFGPQNTTYYTGSNLSVTLRQPLIDGRAWSNLDSAKFSIRAAEAGVLAAEQDVIVRVTQAYFGVLKAAEDERIAQEETRRLKQVLAQAQAFRAAGAGEIIAVKETQARLDLARAALARARSDRHIAQEALYRLTHRTPSVFSDLDAFTPEGPQPDRLEPWLDSAMRTQPMLKQAREALNAAREQVAGAKWLHWPSVELNGGYYYSKGGYIANLQNQQWLIGVNVNLPIYDGDESTGQIRQAQANAHSMQAQLDEALDRIHFETTSAFRRLQDSLMRLHATSQAVQSSQTAWEAVKMGRAVGTRNTIDVLNAEQDYSKAQRDHTLARYEHVLARVQLKAAAGVLSESDVQAINTLLH